ncbi:MAG: hypothetical protein ACRCX2_15055 [Paraclostridium sp.]
MPNYCNFSIGVVGKREKADKLAEYLKADYDKPKHFYRVFDADITAGYELEGDKVAYIISGNCAWSVYSCMFEGEYTYYSSSRKNVLETEAQNITGTTLPIESKELELDIEVFSSEPGMEFMEHYIISNGVIKVDDCVHWSEGYDEDTDTYTPEGGLEWEFSIFDDSKIKPMRAWEAN